MIRWTFKAVLRPLKTPRFTRAGLFFGCGKKNVQLLARFWNFSLGAPSPIQKQPAIPDLLPWAQRPCPTSPNLSRVGLFRIWPPIFYSIGLCAIRVLTVALWVALCPISSQATSLTLTSAAQGQPDTLFLTPQEREPQPDKDIPKAPDVPSPTTPQEPSLELQGILFWPENGHWIVWINHVRIDQQNFQTISLHGRWFVHQVHPDHVLLRDRQGRQLWLTPRTPSPLVRPEAALGTLPGASPWPQEDVQSQDPQVCPLYPDDTTVTAPKPPQAASPGESGPDALYPDESQSSKLGAPAQFHADGPFQMPAWQEDPGPGQESQAFGSQDPAQNRLKPNPSAASTPAASNDIESNPAPRPAAPSQLGAEAPQSSFPGSFPTSPVQPSLAQPSLATPASPSSSGEAPPPPLDAGLPERAPLEDP